MIEAIRDTMIEMAKATYMRGDAEIDYLEGIVASILRDEPVVFLQPGERVLRPSCET